MKDLHYLLEIAKKSALEGGKFLKNNFELPQKELVNNNREIKLQIDKDCERIILDTIMSDSDLPILSEESASSTVLDKTYWIVDPLDGTSNYFRKIPFCAVSIALMHRGIIRLGVIFDFLNNDLYFATDKNGAYCNDSKIFVSNVDTKSQGTLMTGIPAKDNYTNLEFEEMIGDFQFWKKVRMIGSATIATMYVANGYAESYKEKGIFIWDVAAGAIIVKEAGGNISLSKIQDDFRVDAIFTNGKVDT